MTRFDKSVDPGHRPGVRRRQARRARGAPPPRRPVALSGRAQRQGRQGRLARPAHAVLDRQIRLSRARRRGAGRPRRVRRRRAEAVPPLRGFPVVGPLQHALPHRPRRGAAVVRHPARDRGAARLHRASGHAGRRALHEALLPDRQGRRRSHRDPVRGARGPAGQARAGAEPDDGEASARAAAAPLPESEDFIDDNNRLTIADKDVFARDPVNLHPDVPSRAEAQSGAPSRRDARWRTSRSS